MPDAVTARQPRDSCVPSRPPSTSISRAALASSVQAGVPERGVQERRTPAPDHDCRAKVAVRPRTLHSLAGEFVCVAVAGEPMRHSRLAS